MILRADDGIVFARGETIINELLDYLKQLPELVTVESSYFLRLKIVRSKDGSLFIHQQIYVERALSRFGMISDNST